MCAAGNERRALLVLCGKTPMRGDVRAAVRAIRAEGVHCDVRVTYEARDASWFVRSATKDDPGLVIAGGSATVRILPAIVGASTSRRRIS